MRNGIFDEPHGGKMIAYSLSRIKISMLFVAMGVRLDQTHRAYRTQKMTTCLSFTFKKKRKTVLVLVSAKSPGVRLCRWQGRWALKQEQQILKYALLKSNWSHVDIRWSAIKTGLIKRGGLGQTWVALFNWCNACTFFDRTKWIEAPQKAFLSLKEPSVILLTWSVFHWSRLLPLWDLRNTSFFFMFVTFHIDRLFFLFFHF